PRACDKPDATESDQNCIKRIIAGPGDDLKIVDGHPIVRSQVSAKDWRNDVAPKESYINACGPAASVPCNMREAVKIPPDHYFMMGDNRGKSDDSRLWGPVPKSWIIGEAFLTYWPPDRIGFL